MKRRAEEAGLAPAQSPCPMFPAVRIPTSLKNGGDRPQHLAGHASANTTQIYDHCDQQVAREETEKERN